MVQSFRLCKGLVEANLCCRRYLLNRGRGIECPEPIVDDFQRVLAGLFDNSVDRPAVWTILRLLALFEDSLANLGLAQIVDIRATKIFEKTSAVFFIE